LGIGLALVVAKAVLREMYAEVALKAGFTAGVGDVEHADGTTNDPTTSSWVTTPPAAEPASRLSSWDAKAPTARRRSRSTNSREPPSRVEALRVGGATPPSLMVASCLGRTRIASYVLDPPGDGDLWSGSNRTSTSCLDNAVHGRR
jgi:hypothetical protein